MARVNPVASLTAKAAKRVWWSIESATWPVRAPFYRAMLSGSGPMGITIGITTYRDRFEGCLKPLLPKISALFPKDQVIVIANGHYLEDEQRDYISRFNEFCSGFGNVVTEAYIEPRGLSSLWNMVIEKSGQQAVLILNDDIMIRPGFRRVVRSMLAGSDLVVTVNSSWSHFLITPEAVARVGLFDEGLKEIGGEDDDYLARMAIAGISAGNVVSPCISGRSKRRMKVSGLNSYGRDMSKEAGGYSTLNSEYLSGKWETSDTYFEGAAEVPGRRTRYWKLRDSGGNRSA